jgi:hypothetical protein
MSIGEGVLPEHRSEHQAPRRPMRTIVPDAIAEPPSERSVFGEHARRDPAFLRQARYDALTGSAVHCVPSRTTRW